MSSILASRSGLITSVFTRSSVISAFCTTSTPPSVPCTLMWNTARRLWLPSSTGKVTDAVLVPVLSPMKPRRSLGCSSCPLMNTFTSFSVAAFSRLNRSKPLTQTRSIAASPVNFPTSTSESALYP